MLTASLAYQIVPAESNGIDAINFRTMRESKSLDLNKHAMGVSRACYSQPYRPLTS